MCKRKILIVDDSLLNRNLLSGMLQDAYEIVEAENGHQAIRILEKQAYSFSLILLDIVMPEMDGFEVMAYMNKCHWINDLPVIIISAETSQTSVNKAYDLGAVDFISRPFDAYIVQRRVKNTIALYEKQKRLAAIVADQIFERTKMYDQMVSILSQIVEFRNRESGLHVLHINLITEMLLQQVMKKTARYGLKPPDVRVISTASSLHDIGKIIIPDGILNKPGQLTAQEAAVVKTHSVEGALMLKRLSVYQNDPIISTAHDICRWHHERYDGTGYPDGLVGDDIPISAQVVSLADVYDALTSERCYKNAYSHQQAVGMIRRGECGAFNPLLLECLQEIGDKLEQRLQQPPIALKENRKLQRITEEVLQHRELSVPTEMLRQLKFEQLRADFFEGAANERTFVYRSNPPVLTLSRPSASLLGVREVVADPVHDEAIGRCAGASVEKWRRISHETSPESPEFTLDSGFTMDGREALCRCIGRVVWSAEEIPQYLGVVGVITQVENGGVCP
nr:response regulator [bacterium]